jgi:hypothetical protein
VRLWVRGDDRRPVVQAVCVRCHRKRAARAAVSADTPADKVAQPRSENGQQPDGERRVRAGLERWLREREGDDLPPVLIESARVLADQLDHARNASPLWARYTTVLMELITPQLEARAWSAEMTAIYEEMAIISVAEAWRAQRCREAIEAGDDPARWTRLVPLGCCLGWHRWHRHGPNSLRPCLDCHGIEEADGTATWADWLAQRVWNDP